MTRLAIPTIILVAASLVGCGDRKAEPAKAEVKAVAPAAKAEVKPAAKVEVKAPAPAAKAEVKPAAKAEVKPAAKVEVKAPAPAAKAEVKVETPVTK